MMAPVAGPIAQDCNPRDARLRPERASRSAFCTIAAAVSWTAVVAAVLLTVLLLDCVLLGIALVGSGPAPGGQPILERTTHRPAAQCLQEMLWQPLGMEYPASWSLDIQKSGFEKMAMGLNARERVTRLP
jgi:hypothetical protein